jgi:hypothetical protein
MSELATAAGWWWPFRGAVILTERPSKLRRDDRNRLHCADGKAIEYPDGWGFYVWHGTRVPAKVIESPDSFTAEEIRAEPNSEVARALAERLGWEAFLDKIGAKVIDVYKDKNTGLTYELLDTHRFGELQPRFLRMQSPKLLDESQPWYIEKVHPELKTAKAARAWQFMRLDGTWPSPAECNKGIKVEFSKEA